MKLNESESQPEISWINNRPIEKGDLSDSALIGWMIAAFIVSGVVFAMFGGKDSD